MSLVAVTAPDGTLLSIETSQVDAWLRCKAVVGGKMFRCYPNCTAPELIAQSPPAPRSNTDDKHSKSG